MKANAYRKLGLPRVALIFCFFCTCASMIIATQRAHTQIHSEPQARSKEEYDQYLDLLGLTDSDVYLQRSADFAQAWPHSELLVLVYRKRLDLFISKADSEQAIQTARRILELAPDNVDAMSVLAYLLANLPDARQVAEARTYAQRDLELIGRLIIPRSISPGEWSATRKRIEYKAYSALGLASFKEGKPGESISFFVEALRAATVEQKPPVFYRLGVLYRLTGRPEDARSALHAAIAGGSPESLLWPAENWLNCLRPVRPSKNRITPSAPASLPCGTDLLLR